MIWPWLIHMLGWDYTGQYGHIVPYDAWSGSGSDLGELAIIGGIIGLYRKHNCEVHGCWRIGRHLAAGHNVCRRHHPEGKLTPQRIADKYWRTKIGN